MRNPANEHALGELLRVITDSGYTFVPPTPESHRRVNARPGNEEAYNLRDIFGWSRPFHRNIAGERIFELLRDADALEPAGALWKSRVRIATLNGRHYLHSAFPTTAADAVFFGPDTYRFVRALMASLSHRTFPRAVDLGCGSGAGGLSVAAGRDIRELWLCDINPYALILAKANAAHAGQSASLTHSDLFAVLDGEFDLILANPPYLVDPARRAYRDGGGSLGMELGLRILREGIKRLTPGGVMFLYTGAPIAQGGDQFRLAAEQIIPTTCYSVDYSEIDPDVFGEELENPAYHNIDRIAVTALIITDLRTQ